MITIIAQIRIPAMFHQERDRISCLVSIVDKPQPIYQTDGVFCPFVINPIRVKAIVQQKPDGFRYMTGI